MYTHSSELSGAFSVHATDSSRSPKDTFEHVPSRVTQIHPSTQSGGTLHACVRLRGVKRERKTQSETREKWPYVGRHRGVDARREDGKHAASGWADQRRRPGLRWRARVGWGCIQTFSMMLSKSGSSFNICTMLQRQTGSKRLEFRGNRRGPSQSSSYNAPQKGGGTQTLNAESVRALAPWTNNDTNNDEWCQPVFLFQKLRLVQKEMLLQRNPLHGVDLLSLDDRQC